MSDQPRLLLIPEFTELSWAIKPQLEEWAEVASYEPPGIGSEPARFEGAARLTHDHIAQRGLEELDRRRWDRVVVLADGWAIASAARLAAKRPGSVVAMALSHACLTFTRHGPRPAKSQAVWEALTQLLSQDHEAFISHGMAQATGHSIDEEFAQRMLEQFPRELIVSGWQTLTAENVPFRDLLVQAECPMLLAKHEGCLMSTEEGFDDAVAELPRAQTVSVPEAPETSIEYAEAVREFCEAVWPSPGHFNRN